MPQKHLLQQLYLPDRYEALQQHLGPDLVRIFVAPRPEMEESFTAVSQAVITKGRGALIPAWGISGTGKSTLSNSLTHFFGARFASSVAHAGPIDDESLEQTARLAVAKLSPSDDRAIPMVIDGREGEPPSAPELAAIKRFLRTEDGSRAVVLWLETSYGPCTGHRN